MASKEISHHIDSLPKPIQQTIYDSSKHIKCPWCNEFYPRPSYGTRMHHHTHFDGCIPFLRFLDRSEKSRKERIANGVCGVCLNSDASQKCVWCNEWYHSFTCMGTKIHGVCNNCSDACSSTD